MATDPTTNYLQSGHSEVSFTSNGKTVAVTTMDHSYTCGVAWARRVYAQLRADGYKPGRLACRAHRA